MAKETKVVHLDMARISKEGPPPDAPTIRVANGLLDRNASQAEAALIASGMPIYQRGRSLVRPITSEVPASRGRITVAAGLAVITIPSMLDRASRCARWERFNVRNKSWVCIDPPEKILTIVLSRVGEWKFPSIAGVITTPTLRPDGTLLTAPGYDAATRLFHVTDTALDISGHVPFKPTRAHAEAALADLQHLLKNFPTVNEVDHAVALSALISPVVRGAVSVVPMHAFRASTAGTGKTFLVDVVSAIATSRPCPVASVAKSEEETEKRIAGLLLAAFPLMCLDNVNGELGGDLLCQAIERPIVQIRPLGTSEIIEIESRTTVFATGNALRVRGDMTRRSLIGNLDAGVERPELRIFDFDPVEAVLNDRARYVGACLTIVLAHAAAGFPGTDLCTPLASFQDWSRYVRSALLWLGCADPCKSMEDARDDDPELGDLRELLTAWKTELNTVGSFTVAEIFHLVSERLKPEQEGAPAPYAYPMMREVIYREASGRGGIDNRKFGNFLRKSEGRIVQGHRLRKTAKAHAGVVRWNVQAV